MEDQKTSLEETLREHTRDVLARVRHVPGLGFTAKSFTNEATQELEDNKIKHLSLQDLFRPSHHIFVGVWQRTTYVSGAWPLCLSGSTTARVGLSGYDSPTGVVWRFVHPNPNNTNDGSAASGTGYLELVDHALFNSGEQHLYLSRALSLVSSKMEAALFFIERVAPFRNGPADHAIRLSLDSGLSSSSSASSPNDRLVLCSTCGNSGGGGEVMLVHQDRVESRNTDGTYMYNIAFETTPDSDATVQMEMENDEVPLESYMDYTFRMK